ncbi:Zinc finger BED domain-containing protein 1 [Araneus ventricosus]|uniref:Zinc finger BED domain-containing protein 1 n=1 Tax=Araneus ventricosus TaxID=182803 RepID=A0A4Y2VCJ3_ARAVE|nr:Zinc finger BED domain-containing protein 1 [Araneus ventricosus]
MISNLSIQIRQKNVDSVTKFLVGTMQPFNVVESQSFNNMIKTLNPSFKVPSRKFFSKTAVPKLYNDVTESIKRELASVDSNNVCLTTDCWTSLATTPYIAVTAHFIDTEWHLKSVCLCCTQFEENHTSENITQVLKDILSDWNLDAQEITCYTTDNGSNIVKAISMLYVPHMPCFGHTERRPMSPCLIPLQHPYR